MPVVSETDLAPDVFDPVSTDVAFVVIAGERDGYRKCVEYQPASRPATATGWNWYVQIPPGFTAVDLRRIADDMDLRKRVLT